jgi:surfeit locus 1 family protein
VFSVSVSRRSASRYAFRPRLWAVLLTALLAAVMVAAGCWQYNRGVQKQIMQLEHAQLGSQPAQELASDVSTPARGQLRHVQLRGRYQPDLTVLLDNQPQHDQPGVHVWTPMEMADGRRVIIDRGWLPMGQSPAQPPDGLQQISGNWRTLPQPGMRLGAEALSCATPRPSLVTYPDLAAVRCLFGDTTLNGVLELAPDAQGGFGREWAKSGANEIPPSRHFAYAAQWWLFAATLVVLFIKMNLKKRQNHD